MFKIRLHGIGSVLAVLFLSLVGLSCGPRVIDQALVIWSPDEESLASGSIVDILTESDLRDSYNIRYVDSEEREQFIEIERWRLQRADNRDALQALQQEYSEWAPYFGVAEIQALPVRQYMATDDSSAIVYRLREGEQVKILGRTEETVDLGGLVDYWFEILTENGTRGYVFGYRLDAVDAQGVSIEKGDESEDELLAGVLGSVWRPEYFSWMIDEGTYDLSRFRSEYRFVHLAAEKRFSLVTEDFNQSFSYDEIFRARNREYVASGSGLQISVYNQQAISIQFNVDGQTYQENLVRLDSDVDQIISNEIERRQQRLVDFVGNAKSLRSSSYGSMNISENGNLTWTRYGGLDSSMIPSWFQGSAKLSFNLYISRNLINDYEGAVSFTQSGVSIRQSMNFFYRFTSSGLQLEYIPPQNISQNVIVAQALSPFVLFFSFAE